MTVQSKCAAEYFWRGKNSNFSSYRELKILLHKVTELALWAPKYGMHLWFPCRYLHGKWTWVLLWSYSLFFKIVTSSRVFTFLIQWVCYYLTSLISGCPETSSLWYSSSEQPPKGIPFFSECAVRGTNECIGVILNCCSSKGCWGSLTYPCPWGSLGLTVCVLSVLAQHELWSQVMFSHEFSGFRKILLSQNLGSSCLEGMVEKAEISSLICWLHRIGKLQ